MKNKLSLLILMAVLLVQLVYAYDSYPKDTDYNLIISSNNATACNVTYLSHQDNSTIILNLPLIKDGTTFYNNIYKENFTKIELVCMGISCSDGYTYQTGSKCLDINLNGQSPLNSGQGLSLFGGMLVIILVGVFFFILFFKTKNFGLKVVWIGLAIVDIIIAIMFSMVILTQTLGGNEQLINGFATFFYVIRIFLYILIPAFILFVMYIAYKLWNIKRGRQ